MEVIATKEMTDRFIGSWKKTQNLAETQPIQSPKAYDHKVQYAPIKEAEKQN